MSEVAVAAPSTPAPPSEQEVESSEPKLSKNPSGEEAKAYFEKLKQNQPTKQTKPPQDRGMEPDDPPKEKAAPLPPRKYKVKVDGQEEEVDEHELLRGYSHQKAANKVMQESKKAQQQAHQFIEMLKDEGKFFEAAKLLGLDPRALSEKYLVSQLEEEMLDPREKELKQAKQKLKEFEEMEKKQKEDVEKQRHEQLKNAYAEDYNKQFIEALQKETLPPTKGMVGEMAKYISRAAQIGFKMTANEAAQLVKQDLLAAHQRLIGDSDGETLIKLLGENVSNKIRAYDTSKIKNPEQFLKTPEEQGERRKSSTRSNGRMSSKEWARFRRGLTP